MKLAPFIAMGSLVLSSLVFAEGGVAIPVPKVQVPVPVNPPSVPANIPAPGRFNPPANVLRPRAVPGVAPRPGSVPATGGAVTGTPGAAAGTTHSGTVSTTPSSNTASGARQTGPVTGGAREDFLSQSIVAASGAKPADATKQAKNLMSTSSDNPGALGSPAAKNIMNSVVMASREDGMSDAVKAATGQLIAAHFDTSFLTKEQKDACGDKCTLAGALQHMNNTVLTASADQPISKHAVLGYSISVGLFSQAMARDGKAGLSAEEKKWMFEEYAKRSGMTEAEITEFVCNCLPGFTVVACPTGIRKTTG